MQSTFGGDVCSLSLEAIAEISQYMIRHPDLHLEIVTENLLTSIPVFSGISQSFFSLPSNVVWTTAAITVYSATLVVLYSFLLFSKK